MTNQYSEPDGERVYFDTESERALIGACLYDAKVFSAAAGIVSGEDLYYLSSRYIWAALLKIVQDGGLIHYMAVVEQLKRDGHLEDVGGPPAITQIAAECPSTAYVELYAGYVQQAAQRRKLKETTDKLAQQVDNAALTLEELIEGATSDIAAIHNRNAGRGGLRFEQLASTLWDQYARAMEAGGRVMGVTTGITDLDLQIDGLQPGRFYVVGGRPGMGKSALCTHFVMSAAESGKKVAYFLTEMNAEEVGWRIMAQRTQINSRRLRDPQSLTPGQSQRMTDAMENAQLPIWIDDKAQATVSYIRGKCAYAQQVLGGLDVIVIDGMYLMTAEGRTNNRNDEITQISQGLKGLARAYNVPVVTAHQLSRKCEDRADKRPVLSDLRDSGSVEQDADVVIFVYRDVVYNPGTDQPNVGELLVSKNRDGAVGTVSAYFEGSLTAWMNGVARKVDMRDINDLSGPGPLAGSRRGL